MSTSNISTEPTTSPTSLRPVYISTSGSSNNSNSDGSSAQLNIIIVSVTGVIVLVFIIAYCCGKRRARLKREALQQYYNQNHQNSHQSNGQSNNNHPRSHHHKNHNSNHTFNMPSGGLNNNSRDLASSDIYIMRNSDDDIVNPHHHNSKNSHNNYGRRQMQPPPPIQKLPFKIDDELMQHKIDYSTIAYTRKLSKGAFGEVWLGQYKGQYVAIKQILEERKTDKKEIECFVSEIKLMAKLKHANIVDFLGFSWGFEGNLCAITEYMKNGDLFVYLTKRKSTLSWKHDKYSMALDIASALVYLHALSPKLIHRDLKSKNVLLDENCRAKLSDFGISRLRELEETMTAGVGTALWAAPEVFLARKYSEKADVYSLGVVLSELDTCAIPYADQCVGKNGKLDGMQVIKLVTQAKAKPTFSKDCPEVILKLAYDCLAFEPNDRPSAAEVVERLQTQVWPVLRDEYY